MRMRMLQIYAATYQFSHVFNDRKFHMFHTEDGYSFIQEASKIPDTEMDAMPVVPHPTKRGHLVELQGVPQS